MEITKEDFIDMIKDKNANTDISMEKRDVLLFVQNPKELDIWSNDYFMLLADKVR